MKAKKTKLKLTEDRDWLSPSSPDSPILWIREVRLLYRLEVDETALIRKVELHPGLNIVWAKPADPDERDAKARGRGHDVGKTSFCRLIRYLLGEDHFGNKDLRSAITGNKKFERAWVVGEIILEGTTWTVARPLYTGAHHFAVRGKKIQEGIVSPMSERIRHEDFIVEIEKKVVGKFAVQTFDNEGKNPIRWLHVLEWLARDQEAHLSNLFEWRHTSSDSRSPELSADEAQYLARCLLDVTDVEERKQIEIRKGLNRDKTTETDNSAYYDRRIKDALERASNELPNGKALPKVGEALFVDVVVRHAKELTNEKRKKLEGDLGKLNLKEAEDALEKAIGNRAVVEGKHDELKQLVDESRDALARFKEKKQPTQNEVDELDSVLSKLRPDRAFCEIPVNIALFRCPLLQEKRLGEGDKQEESPRQNIAALANEKREHIEKQLAGLNRNLRQFSQQLGKLREKEFEARTKRNEIQGQVTTLKEEIAKLDDEAAAWKVRAEDAVFSHSKLEASRTTLKEIETALGKSKVAQEKAQKTVRERQMDLTEVFMAVCHYFKGKEADAELKFTLDQINARIGSGPGAYNALSSISFDFAALIARLNGVGQHPGFLLHDSPRESDMELSLYRPLFRFIKEIQDKAPNSFQYIVTTTESPPEELSSQPHLCLFLDGSKPEGKLFKENL